jgi:hypothetical protein
MVWQEFWGVKIGTGWLSEPENGCFKQTRPFLGKYVQTMKLKG